MWTKLKTTRPCLAWQSAWERSNQKGFQSPILSNFHRIGECYLNRQHMLCWLPSFKLYHQNWNRKDRVGIVRMCILYTRTSQQFRVEEKPNTLKEFGRLGHLSTRHVCFVNTSTSTLYFCTQKNSCWYDWSVTFIFWKYFVFSGASPIW